MGESYDTYLIVWREKQKNAGWQTVAYVNLKWAPIRTRGLPFRPKQRGLKDYRSINFVVALSLKLGNWYNCSFAANQASKDEYRCAEVQIAWIWTSQLIHIPSRCRCMLTVACALFRTGGRRWNFLARISSRVKKPAYYGWLFTRWLIVRTARSSFKNVGVLAEFWQRVFLRA